MSFGFPTPQAATPSNGLNGIIGSSQAMQELFDLVRRVAPTSATVLLTGETGTGKELVAQAVHDLSDRSTGPFIRVNCGALSESLLESELFGHVKGAFTNAYENRTGRFEAAHGGTIFLDEINSVSQTMQVKLLRVLQEHEFERVGDTKTITVDCRIIAATNRDLLDQIDEGTFREDLYYRLNVIPVYLPALRERQSDLPALVKFFSEQYARINQRDVPEVPSDTLSMLKLYPWPGNVRELQNYVERAIVLSHEPKLVPDLFPAHVRGLAPVRIGRSNRDADSLSREDANVLCQSLVKRGITDAIDEDAPLHGYVVSLVERELIQQVLRSCQGVQTKAAGKLGINRNTLHKKIEEYHLDEDVR